MTQIFLVRHGQSEGNLFRRVQGQTDVELTADDLKELAGQFKAALPKRRSPPYIPALSAARRKLPPPSLAGGTSPFLWTSGSLKCASARGKCAPGAR